MVYDYYKKSNKSINQGFENLEILSFDDIDPSTTFYCRKCGKKNKFFHTFCYYCGENLNDAKDVIRRKFLLLEMGKSEILLCPECENIIENDNEFCEHCGIELKKRSRYIPKTIKEVVWLRDNGKCVECGSQEDLQFDHIIPFSKGGANTAKNIQILCARCNKKKFNKING